MGKRRYWTSARLLRWIIGCLVALGMTPILFYNTLIINTEAFAPDLQRTLNIQYTIYNWEPTKKDILYQNITHSSSSQETNIVRSHEGGITAGTHKSILSQYVKKKTLNSSSQRDKNMSVAIAHGHNGSKDSWGVQCKGIPTSVVLPSQLIKDSWQSGQDMKQVKIFSAFYDDRRSTSRIGAVQVLGMYSMNSIPKFCHLVYGGKSGVKKGGDSPKEEVISNHLSIYITTVAAIAPSRQGRNRYSPAIFTCPLKFPGTPLGVTLVSEKCHVGNSSLYLKVQDDHLLQPLYNFTICVAPLYHTDITNVRRFIEHVEINKAFGADRFVYYNHSVGVELVNALKLYEQEGLNEVLQWTLPVDIKEVVYYAQIAAQNDCLLRYMYKSKYVIFTDLDEFIIPKNSTNWHDMLKQIIDRQKTHASYIIRNVFFHLEFSDHPKALKDIDVQSLEIMPLKKLRSEAPQKFGHRSKYICDPRLSLFAAVHNLNRATNVRKQVFVTNNLAMLHHYRNWGVREGTQVSTLDMSMYSYRDLIVSNIRRVHKKLDILPVKVNLTGSQ